jgi:hypothetical protein
MSILFYIQMSYFGFVICFLNTIINFYWLDLFYNTFIVFILFLHFMIINFLALNYIKIRKAFQILLIFLATFF